MPGLQRVAFNGPHQAGIDTPQHEHLHFAAFDLTAESTAEIRDLLRAWSEAGARMAAGEPAEPENDSSFVPPDDTGEAFGLSPARLTLTFGFGQPLFERGGEDRFGLAGRRPEALAEIPPLPGDADLMDRYVWVPEGEGPSWMTGGTYLVARRIRMLIEVWDRASLADQEGTIGRHKYSGAPIGSENEFDPVDLEARGEDGELLIPEDSHVRLARQSDEEKILRRGYSFTDGMDHERGQLDAGLFFICFQRDPRLQFVPLQRRLGSSDLLNEYIQHTGSAVFACPRGAREGGYVGEALFEEA